MIAAILISKFQNRFKILESDLLNYVILLKWNLNETHIYIISIIK